MSAGSRRKPNHRVASLGLPKLPNPFGTSGGAGTVASVSAGKTSSIASMASRACASAISPRKAKVRW